MSLTRDDVLRELELLPVWQLRTPVPQIEETQAPVPAELPTQSGPETQTQVNLPALRMLVSEDACYLFLLETPLTGDEEILLQRMLNSIDVKPSVDIGLQGMSELRANAAKAIIAMGQLALKNLNLQVEDGSIHALRGQVHQTDFGPAVVTFHPEYLLQNPTDKALAWEDLCLARSIAQRL